VSTTQWGQRRAESAGPPGGTTTPLPRGGSTIYNSRGQHGEPRAGTSPTWHAAQRKRGRARPKVAP
jgi:hypothetical protein